MSKEVLITDILTNKLKSVQGEIEGQTKTNKSAKSQPDDEWSVDGDPIKGRKNKESILEGCNYTIGYITAVKDLIPEFLEFLNKTESELKNMIERREKDDKEKTEQFNKLFTKTTKEKNRDPHYNYCKLKGTSRPWGIDEECTCPDAYILRK